MNGKIDMLAATLERAILEEAPKTSHSSANDLIHPQLLSIPSSEYLPRHDGKNEDKPLVGASTECFTRTSFKTVDRFFGFMKICSVSRQYIGTGTLNEDAENNESSVKVFTFNIPVRFGSCRKGFKLCINDTFDNWCLNSIRRLPNDSAVFKLCAEGNATEVERLFAFRKASIYDVNESGQSVLHVSRPFLQYALLMSVLTLQIACNNGHSKICRFLIEEGADVFQTDDLGKYAKNIPLRYHVSLVSMTTGRS